MENALIFYADGTVLPFDQSIPRTNVIKIYHEGETVSQGEYYVFKYGKWRRVFCSCIADKHRQLGDIVLDGVWVPDELFKEIMNK